MVSLTLLFLLLALPLFTYQKQYTCQTQTPCGCSEEWKIQSKIVGGEKVKKRSWGWIVSLVHQSNQSHFCAGSILSSSWILTAAHCVADRYSFDILVNAGSNRLDQPIQQRDIEVIISHPSYDAYTYTNDIALIRLSSPLDMKNSALAKICLPTWPVISLIGQSDGDNIPAVKSVYPPIGSKLVAIGWGQTSEDILLPSNELREVIVKAIAYKSRTCRHLISSSAVQFCAGVENGGRDACGGDSGGPLMKLSSGRRWMLAGVISYGRGCGQAEHSGVYTRVASYAEWIKTTINAEDVFNDPVYIVHDKSYRDKSTDKFLEELLSNTGSHRFSSTSVYISILFGLFLCFI